MAERSTTDGSMLGADQYFDSPQADSMGDSLSLGDGKLEDTLNEIGYQTKQDPAAASRAESELQPIPNGGPLLEEPSAAKIFKTIHKEIERQEPLAKNREESGKHWGLIASGAQFTVLEKNEDLSIYKQAFVPGFDSTPQPIPNKIADLKKKIISQVLVDPPLPDPKPDGADSDRNRGATDLTKKFLRADGTPTGTNDQELFREALNVNMTRASAFAWVWVDPTGGGWRPKQVKAHPQATDANNPLVGPKLGPDDQPIMINGQPITERTTDPVLRYVAEVPSAGEPADTAPETDDDEKAEAEAPQYVFTNDPSAAARQWMPKLVRRLLFPAHVRCHPPTANAFTAQEIDLLVWETWGDAKRRFPILETVTTTQAKELCGWRPKRWKALVPMLMRPKGGDIAMTSDGEVSDDTLFFWYHRYCRVGTRYIDGGEVAITGGNKGGTAGYLLKRDTLREDVEIDDGTKVPVLMLPPVSQFMGLHDTEGGDPNGLAPVSEFGGANELYAHLYISMIDGLQKELNPNVYIPATSPISREDYNRRDGTPLEILVPEDKPFIEPGPQIPAFAPQLLDRVEQGMNSAAGTNQTSNGLDSEYAKSGVAKDISIRQAKVALAQYWQNTAMGITYYWQVKTKLAQAKLTVPQQVMMAGTESAYKQKWWIGSDLLGVSQIPIAAGTGTMMAGTEKLQSLQMMQNAQWLDPVQAAELARSSMADDLGLPPNVHEEHIDRCVGEWIDGPPPGWEDAFKANADQAKQYQTVTQQSVAALISQGTDPQQAQQQVQQQSPPPQPQPMWTPFDPRPNDDEPGVAKIRAKKLSDLMATPDYTKQTPGWRALVDDVYKRAFYSAGGKTVEQQAQEAQQAAQAQQQAKAPAPDQADQADPNYDKFKTDVTNKVMGAVTTFISKEVAADVTPGGPQAPDPNAPSPDSGPPAPDPTVLLKQAADHAHQAQEADKQRTHDAQQGQLDRSATLHGNVFKAALDARTRGQQNLARTDARTAAGNPAAPGALPQ
jgi:hypothetical protein